MQIDTETDENCPNYKIVLPDNPIPKSCKNCRHFNGFYGDENQLIDCWFPNDVHTTTLNPTYQLNH